MTCTVVNPLSRNSFFFLFVLTSLRLRMERRGTIKLCIRHNCKAAFFGENPAETDESEGAGSSERQLGPVCQSIVVYVRGTMHVSMSTSPHQHRWHKTSGCEKGSECLFALYTCVVDRFYAHFQLNSHNRPVPPFPSKDCYSSFCFFVFFWS